MGFDFSDPQLFTSKCYVHFNLFKKYILFSTGSGTQDVTYGRQVFYHYATSQTLTFSHLKTNRTSPGYYKTE